MGPASGAPAAETIEHVDANGNNGGEYAQEMYLYMRELEEREPLAGDYLARQSGITEAMRDRVIDWLVELHMSFAMQPDVCFIAVSFLDRFLSQKPIPMAKLQLAAITAFELASKYDSSYTPQLSYFAQATGDSCRLPDIVGMEKLLLNTLKFILSFPTPYDFLKRIATVARASQHEGIMSRFFAELTLMDYRICTRYRPSVIAAASMSVALRCNKKRAWTPTLQQYTTLSEAELEPCVAEIMALVRRSPTAKFTAVFKKYSQAKYLKIAVTAVQALQSMGSTTGAMAAPAAAAAPA